jgi:hypothetical protein
VLGLISEEFVVFRPRLVNVVELALEERVEFMFWPADAKAGVPFTRPSESSP